MRFAIIFELKNYPLLSFEIHFTLTRLSIDILPITSDLKSRLKKSTIVWICMRCKYTLEVKMKIFIVRNRSVINDRNCIITNECTQGRHTSKSDVWSFAVTLWEILTFAREQPFEELPDHRIVENATYFYQEDDRRVSINTSIK